MEAAVGERDAAKLAGLVKAVVSGLLGSGLRPQSL